MTTIYKYQLNDEFNEIEMPSGAEILSVQTQNNIPCIWAIVETDNPIEKRKLMIVGTGNEMNPCVLYVFIGTFQLVKLGLVYHVFEIPNYKKPHVLTDRKMWP